MKMNMITRWIAAALFCVVSVGPISSASAGVLRNAGSLDLTAFSIDGSGTDAGSVRSGIVKIGRRHGGGRRAGRQRGGGRHFRGNRGGGRHFRGRRGRAHFRGYGGGRRYGYGFYGGFPFYAFALNQLYSRPREYYYDAPPPPYYYGNYAQPSQYYYPPSPYYYPQPAPRWRYDGAQWVCDYYDYYRRPLCR